MTSTFNEACMSMMNAWCVSYIVAWARPLYIVFVKIKPTVGRIDADQLSRNWVQENIQ